MFEIYGKPNCSWCEKAKALITSKGDTYKYLELGVDYNLEELYDIFGDVKTVPQIAHDFGGYTGWGIIGPYTELEEFYGIIHKDT